MPEKVQWANDARWKEFSKMAKIERRLSKEAHGRTGTKALHPRAEPTLNPPIETHLRTMWNVQPVQRPRLRNMRQLPRGRADGHKGTKPRGWHTLTRTMRGRAEEMCELARAPASTNIVMGDVQHSQTT